MTNFYQTSSDTKVELNTILKKILLILHKDQSLHKQNLLDRIGNFVNKPRATLVDLEELYNNVVEYQLKLKPSDNIELYNSVQELLIPLKTLVRYSRIGYLNVNGNLISDHLLSGDFAQILKNFANSNTYKSPTTYNGILTPLFSQIQAVTDPSFNRLELDINAGHLDVSRIKSNLQSMTNNYGNNLDQFLVAEEVYKAITDGYTLTDVRGAVSLLNYIETRMADLDMSFSSFINQFRTQMQLANVVGLSQDTPVIGVITLLFFALSHVFNDSAYMEGPIKQSLAMFSLDALSTNLASADIISNLLDFKNALDNVDSLKSFVAKLYNCIANGDESSISGAAKFITDQDFSQDVLPSVLGPQVKLFVSNLAQASYNNYGELASAIAAISNSVSSDTIRALTMDMAASGNPISQLQQNLAYVKEAVDNHIDLLTQDGVYTAGFNDINNKLILALYNSFNLGQYYGDLSSSINYDVSFINAMQSLSSDVTIVDSDSLAHAIASTIIPYSSQLANHLKEDIDNVGLKIADIKFSLKKVNGASASDVTADLYNAWGGAFISGNYGAMALASEIDYYNKQASDISEYFTHNSIIEKQYYQKDNYVLASVLAKLIRGDDTNSALINYLHQDFSAASVDSSRIIETLANLNNNYAEGESKGALITAQIYHALHYPHDSAVPGKTDFASAIYQYYATDPAPTFTSAAGNTPIAPAAKYLNRCTKVDDVYSVGNSVFYLFDQGQYGGLLSQMPELFTFSGQNSAVAQCGRYIKNYTGYELYVTKTQPFGVQGTKEETGCSELLSPAVFMAMCNSVFTFLDDVF